MPVAEQWPGPQGLRRRLVRAGLLDAPADHSPCRVGGQVAMRVNNRLRRSCPSGTPSWSRGPAGKTLLMRSSGARSGVALRNPSWLHRGPLWKTCPMPFRFGPLASVCRPPTATAPGTRSDVLDRITRRIRSSHPRSASPNARTCSGCGSTAGIGSAEVVAEHDGH